MIVKIAEGHVKTKFGVYRELLFYNGREESIALVMGDVDGHSGVLCRVHSFCLSGHYYNSSECLCRQKMKRAQQIIEKEGKGVIILLNQEGMGNGHFAWLKWKGANWYGFTRSEAYEAIGFKKDARDYFLAFEILEWLNINSVRVITNNRKKIKKMEALGIDVTGIEPVDVSVERSD